MVNRIYERIENKRGYQAESEMMKYFVTWNLGSVLKYLRRKSQCKLTKFEPKTLKKFHSKNTILQKYNTIE